MRSSSPGMRGKGGDVAEGAGTDWKWAHLSNIAKEE